MPPINADPHPAADNEPEDVHVRCIFDPEDTHGFVYTDNLARMHPDHVELISFNVPREDMVTIASMLMFLGERLRDGHSVKGGQLAQKGDTKYFILDVPQDLNDALMQTHACQCCGAATLLVVAPLNSIPFSVTSGDITHEFSVSGILAYHMKKEKLTTQGSEEDRLMYKAIIDKWTENRGRLVFRNLTGDWRDVNPMNYKIITLYDAMIHPEWHVDWDNELTEEEIAFVRENMSVFADLYKPLESRY